MEDILKKISDIIDTYDSGHYNDIYELQRKLACNLFYLAQFQVEYHQKHNAAYFTHASTVNAVKQRYADKEVEELYLCRKIGEAGKNVSIAMSLEIKMN